MRYLQVAISMYGEDLKTNQEVQKSCSLHCTIHILSPTYIKCWNTF